MLPGLQLRVHGDIPWIHVLRLARTVSKPEIFLSGMIVFDLDEHLAKKSPLNFDHIAVLQLLRQPDTLLQRIECASIVAPLPIGFGSHAEIIDLFDAVSCPPGLFPRLREIAHRLIEMALRKQSETKRI